MSHTVRNPDVSMFWHDKPSHPTSVADLINALVENLANLLCHTPNLVKSLFRTTGVVITAKSD